MSLNTSRLMRWESTGNSDLHPCQTILITSNVGLTTPLISSFTIPISHRGTSNTMDDSYRGKSIRTNTLRINMECGKYGRHLLHYYLVEALREVSKYLMMLVLLVVPTDNRASSVGRAPAF